MIDSVQNTSLLDQVKMLIEQLDQKKLCQHNQINNLDYAIDMFEFVCEEYPQSAKDRYQIIEQTFAKVLVQATPKQSYHFLNSVCIIIKNYPKYFKANISKITNLIDVILELICSMSQQVKQDWVSPPSDSLQADLDNGEDQQQLVGDLCCLFDQLSCELGYSKMIELFLPRVGPFMQKKDWRGIYAVLMAMSQLGEDIEQPSIISDFIDLGISSLKHPNPKVRYAALQMIGQLSDDMKPLFQQCYTEIVIPPIVEIFKDPVIRVTSHSLACLTNLLEEYSDLPRIVKYTKQILDCLLYHCQSITSPAYIKQNALTLLASLATISRFFDSNTIVLAFQMIKLGLQYTLRKQIKSQAIEALSFLITYQDIKHVGSYLNESLNLMVSSMQNSDYDPTYIANAWCRIFKAYKAPIGVNLIYTSIFQISKKLSQFDINEEKAGCQVLSYMAESYGNQLNPYFQEIMNFAKSIYQNSSEIDIRSQSINLMLSIVKTTKTQAPDPTYFPKIYQLFNFFVESTKMFLTTVNFNPEDSQNLANGLQTLIETMGSNLNQQNIKAITQQIIITINFITNTIKQRREQLNAQQSNPSTYSESLCEQYQKNIQKLNDLLLIFPDIFQSLIKVSNLQITRWIISTLLPHIETQFILQDADTIRYGLYYLANFVDTCPQSLVLEYWSLFNTQFSTYTLSNNCQVRNSAVYGIGSLSEKTPLNLVSQVEIHEWLNLISKSASIERKQEPKKDYNFTRDNIISALGKILKKFSKEYNLTSLYKQWLKQLPLNTDIIQGNYQHSILISILQQNPSILIQHKDDIIQILKIYCKFIMKRSKYNIKNQQILQKTKKSLISMNQWQVFKQNIDYLWNSLSQSEKYHLKMLCE